jgi:hypothetical protein
VKVQAKAKAKVEVEVQVHVKAEVDDGEVQGGGEEGTKVTWFVVAQNTEW